MEIKYIYPRDHYIQISMVDFIELSQDKEWHEIHLMPSRFDKPDEETVLRFKSEKTITMIHRNNTIEVR